MVSKNRDGLTPLSTACWLDITRDEGNLTLSLHGEFDLACEERFQRELAAHMDEAPSQLVLDLRALSFMDSSGLGMLLSLDGIARTDAFEFAIRCDDEGAVRRVLRVTGLDGILPVVTPFGPVPATDSPV